MPVLTLKDDIDSVDFIFVDGGSNDFPSVTAACWLEDNSFSADVPTKKEVRFDSNSGAGRDLLSMSYSNRTITFKFYIVADSEWLLFERKTLISRMLMRAQSPIYINGGAYSQEIDYTSGNNSGDQGLVLLYRYDDSTETVPDGVTWKSEKTGTGLSSSNFTKVVTFRIIYGDLQVERQVSGAHRNLSVSNQKKYMELCTLTLEAEPFALGRARVVGEVTGNGFYGFPVQPDDATKINRMFISGDAIPGDAPALTRITTQLENAQGIIIARDAGVSLLNSMSYPEYSGSGLHDMFAYGQVYSATGHEYQVRTANTASNPDQYQWRVDGGSWSTAANIVAMSPIEIATDVFIFFWNSNGHNGTEVWTFKNNQAVLNSTHSGTNLYSNKVQAYSNDGIGAGAVNITIPPGCRSRYKVYANFTITGGGNPALDYRMGVTFMGYGSGARTSTQVQQYDWISGNSAFIDCGIIDLTPRVSPYRLHPSGFTEAMISFSVRSNGVLPNPSTITLNRVFLVPYQDDYSFLHVGWAFDAEGREVYCNYDAANPYIADISGNYFDSPDPDIVTVTALDETHAGNVITLIPGVTNTLLFIPLFTASTDWRDAIPSSSAYTQSTNVAIRPRYLYGG